MGKHWAPDDMPNQSGRRVIVTGANSGIGYFAAVELARKGAHVLLACRDRARGEAALAEMRQVAPNASAETALLDLASLASIRRFATGEVDRGLPLELLINNAGVMAPRRRLETEDGFELQFGTNVVGHFLLTAMLLPALIRAAESSSERPRIVTVASIAHKRGRLDFDDLQSKANYNPMRAYQQSKLADLMFALELDRRLNSAGAPAMRIMSVAAHPGVANTNLFQAGEFGLAERLARRGFGVAINTLLNSGLEGALPTLYAATASDARSGGYYGPQGFREMRGLKVGVAQIAPRALDLAAAERLWSECERLTGMKLLR
ncbi:MAG TPA: oxidoreductase [Acidobacteriaceae bacterium]|jgi:NAD(P)-dependent dehydrogenase (short-subunit alcohol dehydrogenase family)|nr:oxidoreductase [Acidobacteriaceae bacterium]